MICIVKLFSKKKNIFWIYCYSVIHTYTVQSIHVTSEVINKLCSSCLESCCIIIMFLLKDHQTCDTWITIFCSTLIVVHLLQCYTVTVYSTYMEWNSVLFFFFFSNLVGGLCKRNWNRMRSWYRENSCRDFSEYKVYHMINR